MSFLPEQTKTLRQLSELWRTTPFVLIGANALALQIDLEWRQTNDLDFVISIALEDYPAGLETLPGWQRRREGDHAWLSPTGVKVDVVPAGPGLLDAGSTSASPALMASLQQTHARELRDFPSNPMWQWLSAKVSFVGSVISGA